MYAPHGYGEEEQRKNAPVFGATGASPAVSSSPTLHSASSTSNISFLNGWRRLFVAPPSPSWRACDVRGT